MSYHLLAVGQTLSLPSYVNATAGYTASSFTTSNLKVVKEKWVAPPSDVTGAGAEGNIIIQAISAGTGYYGQWNHRAWEQGDVSFTPVTIEVVEPHELIEINLHILNNKIVGYSEITTDIFHPIDSNDNSIGNSNPRISTSKTLASRNSNSRNSDSKTLASRNSNSKTLASRNSDSNRDYDEVVPVKIKYFQGKIDFYRLNGELLYHRVMEQPFPDFMFCVSDSEGRDAGCPSGGISGHGDGKIPNFGQAVLLGTISF